MSKLSYFLRMLLAGAALLPAGKTCAQDYIVQSGSINNAPVRLFFDTESISFLFQRAPRRIGLLVTPDNRGPDVPSTSRVEFTESYAFKSGLIAVEHPFPVFKDNSIGPEDIDGVLGWSDMELQDNKVFLVNAETLTVEVKPLPADIQRWKKWKIVPNNMGLVIECPNGAEMLRIGIDTTVQEGVLLNAAQWQKWRAARADKPSTNLVYYIPGQKLEFLDMLRARKLTLGDLSLEDVPVSMRPQAADFITENSDATLGLAALKRMQLIIDRKNGVVYTLPTGNTLAQYSYNGLGGMFVVNDPEKDKEMVAHVGKDSAAEAAGIKEGDILLKVDGTDMVESRETNEKLHKIFSGKPGTKLNLVLKRDGKLVEATVTQRELPQVD